MPPPPPLRIWAEKQTAFFIILICFLSSFPIFLPPFPSENPAYATVHTVGVEGLALAHQKSQ